MKYKYNLTEEQNIAIDKIFPNWTMDRDNYGNIVIYPNLDEDEDDDEPDFPFRAAWMEDQEFSERKRQALNDQTNKEIDSTRQKGDCDTSDGWRWG